MDQKKYLSQVRFLNKCSAHYYLYDESLIPDEVFDKLFLELQSYESTHQDKVCQESPTQRVGAVVNKSDLMKKEHKSPMGSLDNAFSLDEAKNFMEKYGSAHNPYEVVVEPKIDGLAINLIYKKGLFQYALTRGDGFIGEDVTHTVKTISSIPMELQDKDIEHLEIRGEVFISLTTFKKINEFLKKNNEKIFSNPRNAAAGTIRQLDAKVAAERKLSFFPYDIVGHPSITSQSMAHDWLIHQEFFLSNLISPPLKDIKSVYKYFQEINTKRNSLNYEIDGLVIKVNNFSHRLELGSTFRAPKWAFAWKFKASTAITTLCDIDFQVGRLGTITPVAKLKPVEIGGVTVRSATLHNEEEIKRKNLFLYDKVLIRRSGDVIPEVIEAITDSRDGSEKPVMFPEVCPSCLRKLMKVNTSHFCPNHTLCPEQNILQLVHFCSKHALNVEHLSVATIRQLFAKNLLKKKEDLFSLKREDFLELEGFGEKSTERLMQAIEKSRYVADDKLLYALGAPHIGRVLAKKIVKAFSLHELMGMSAEDLQKTDGIGKIVADSLVDYFQGKDNKQTLLFLLDHLYVKELSRKSQLKEFTEKKVVITGSFGGTKREDIETLIENLGHKVQKQVNKRTDYLVAGENSGTKYQKAQNLKVPIISFTELEEILRKSS